MVDERGVEVALLAPPARPARRSPWLGARADVEEPGVAADGQRAAADDLHPGVLLGVVRGGDHDAAVEPQLADREIDHLRPDHPDVQDVDAGVGGSPDDRRGHGRAGHAHVAPDGDVLRLEQLRVGAADRVGALLVELGRVDPADVVGLEDLGIEGHARMLRAHEKLGFELSRGALEPGVVGSGTGLGESTLELGRHEGTRAARPGEIHDLAAAEEQARFDGPTCTSLPSGSTSGSAPRPSAEGVSVPRRRAGSERPPCLGSISVNGFLGWTL